jgi:hypothetical protein
MDMKGPRGGLREAIKPQTGSTAHQESADVAHLPGQGKELAATTLFLVFFAIFHMIIS